jgi:hypothetical protein
MAVRTARILKQMRATFVHATMRLQIIIKQKYVNRILYVIAIQQSGQWRRRTSNGYNYKEHRQADIVQADMTYTDYFKYI